MFTADTTVLTTERWKGYRELSTRDKVATFNRMTEEIEYHRPTDIRIVFNYSKPLLRIKTRNTDQLLTSNHKVLLKKPFRRNYIWYWDSYWSFEYLQNIKRILISKTWAKIPLAGKYRQGQLSIGRAYAELLGWIITDGHFTKRSDCNSTVIVITQSSAKKHCVKRIRFLLNYLKETNGINFSESKSKYDYKGKKPSRIGTFSYMHTFQLSGNFALKIRRDIPDRKPTWDLLQLKHGELVGLMQGLILGDGHIESKTLGKFYQKNPYTRVWFQALCVLLGLKSKNSSSWIYVSVGSKNTHSIEKENILEAKNRKCIVWGLEIINQTIIARRNGSVFITGDN